MLPLTGPPRQTPIVPFCKIPLFFQPRSQKALRIIFPPFHRSPLLEAGRLRRCCKEKENREKSKNSMSYNFSISVLLQNLSLTRIVSSISSGLGFRSKMNTSSIAYQSILFCMMLMSPVKCASYLPEVKLQLVSIVKQL